jgi:hypothetical protein
MAATKTRNPTSEVAVTGTWSGTNRHLLVDDHPDTTGADKTTCSANGVLALGFSAFDVPAGATSISVQVLYYDSKNGSPSSTVGALIRCNDTTNRLSSTHNPANATFTSRSDNYATNPKSSSAWTVNDVNGVGTNGLTAFGISVTDANPTVDIASVQLQVTYTMNYPLTGDGGSYSVSGTDVTFKKTYVLSADSGSHAVTGTDATLTYDDGSTLTRTDDFNRTDGGLGANWTTPTGASGPVIESNVIVSHTASFGWVGAYRSDATFSNDNFSELEIVRFGSNSAFAGPAVRVSPDAQTFYYLEINSAGGAAFGKQVNGSEDNNQTIPNDTFTVGSVARIEVTGSDVSIYKNGVQVGTTWTDGSPITTGAPGVVFYTNDGSGGSTNIAFDNWQGGDMGAADPVLSAEAGSHVITGTAASLEFGRTVSAESGSYSWTGTESTLKVGHKLSAESGSYSLTGTAAGLLVGHKLSANAGSYAWTGTDATLTYDPVGQFTLTAEAGAYSLTGTDAGLLQGYEIAADAGSYATSGTAAGLFYGYRVAASSASYSVSGTAAGLRQTHVLPAQSGSYSVTGTAATLTHVAVSSKCVTPSGAGAGTGADWDNALSWASATPARGETWYLADGTYSSKTLDTANSGASVITIKKATASSHVTETGWSSGMGDGQAVISELTLGSDYWTVDGVVRNESDWKDGNSYGFRITSVTASTAITPNVAASHVVMRYINGGGTEGTTYTGSEPTHAFRIAGFDEIATDWTIERCYMHNIGSIALCHLYGLDTGLIQYNWLGNAWGKEAIIGSIVFKNVVIRYNVLKDAAGNTGLPGEGATADIAIWNSDNAGDFDNNKIYGNVVWRTRDENNGGTIVVGGDNGVGWAGVPASNTEVYNNTIAGIQNALGGLILINGGTGNIARNNLWWDTGTFSGASANTESDNVIASSDPFVDYSTGDFHLSSTIAGFDLSSPYDEDLEGEIRGNDGTFDVGAFEFVTDTNRTLTAESASFSLTGTTASLEFGRYISAGSATYSLTGTTAGLLTGRKLAANSGTYALTGTDAGLLKGSKLPASTAAYAVTGTDAGLIYQQAGQYTISAESGSFATSGTTAGLKVGHKVAANNAAYSVSGTAASLEYGRKLSASTTSYLVSGTAATLTYQPTTALVADSGAFSITGSTVGFLYGRALAASGGSFFITGFPVTDDALFVPPTLGHITATESSATIAATDQRRFLAGDAVRTRITVTEQ